MPHGPELLALGAILAALLLGAASPGPSFVVVARLAATRTRRHGLSAALGMGVGGALFAGLALGGLVALLMQVEALYTALRVAGGLYLVWLGIRLWRGADAPLAVEGAAGGPASLWRSFLWGLTTQVSNPKTALVYAGIFAALLPVPAPGWLLVALPPLVLALETGWYALVAVVFSAEVPRRAYLRGKGVVDRLGGAVLGALGGRLVADALGPRG